MLRNCLILGFLWLASCQTTSEKLDLPNSKLLNVIHWSDTGYLETADLFDNGIADSLVNRSGNISFLKLDSSRYSLFGGSSPYAVLRAFQSDGFVDVVTLKKDSSYNLVYGGMQFSTEGVKIELNKKGKRFWILQDNLLLLDTSFSDGVFDIEPYVKNKPGRSYLRVFGYGDSGVFADLIMPLENGSPVLSATELTRHDLHGNVMYFAFLDRFYDGNPANNRKVNHPLVTEKTNYHGGDIKGLETVIQKGYLNGLGINSVWISPITRNPDGAWGNFKDPHVMFSGYHGYWPSLSTVIDPRMGTKAELESALKTAHDSGLNVLLDYVAHHVHKEHPIYKVHPDWVTPLYLPDGSMNTERWDDHRLTTWFDTFMPTLDLGRPEIASYMVDSALFWLHEFDFDGFRHDATKHIPENFTRLLTKRIRTVVSTKDGRNRYQIGETYGDPKLISSYVGSGLLDAQFDFNLYDRMVDVFAFGDPMERLVKEQQRSIETYGLHHLMGNITGNQDRVRFMSFADGTLERSKDWNELKRIGHLRDLPAKGNKGYESFGLFYAYQMTAPGIPVIYYGDEYGMTGANDPGNRNPMKFEGLTEQEVKLKKWVTECIALRRESLALTYGDFEFLFVSPDQVVTRRTYRGETVITVINRSEQPFVWEPSTGYESYGKLTKRLVHSSEAAFKNLWKLGSNSTHIYQFKK